MIEGWFSGWSPVLQALVAGLFTWGLTAFGASVVFLAKELSRRVLDAALGFAGGVMLAASVWSLLVPSIELAGEMGWWPWVPPLVGVLLGSALIGTLNGVIPSLQDWLGMVADAKAGSDGRDRRRSLLLVLAITLHNIPEGLAVGVAFGAAASGSGAASLAAALALALGIGIQNIPEGAAVALPLRREGLARRRCFWFGQMSGWVEPLAAVLGAAAVLVMQPLLPFALALAAGAMIHVVIAEVVPESQCNGNARLATLGSLGGFALMMTLDVALG